jgi:hypothetical protein
MKNIYSLFLFTILSLPIFAQGIASSWAKSAGDTSVDIGYSITSDLNGNVLVAGYFDSPSITFGNFTLINSLQNSIFIVKYNSIGEEVWAKNIGIDSSQVSGISTDDNGNVFIIGSFSPKEVILGLDTLRNSGMSSMYIAKYDSNGDLLWARSAGGNSYCAGTSITTDANGELLISGNYFDSNITLGNITLPNSGEWDFFIAKYTANGNLLWAKRAGEERTDIVNSISTDYNRNILIAGSFSSSNITIGTSLLTNSSNDDDVFLAKYDMDGNAIWAKSAGGEALDKAVSICSDSIGNVFITGTYHSPSITFGTTTLSKVYYSDVFVVKYDALGNPLWANNIGGSFYEYACGVGVDSNGNVIVTAGFNSPTLTIGTKTLTTAGYGDIFIAKYNSSGNHLSAYNIGGTNHEEAYSSSVDASGNIYITGTFYSPMIVIGNDTLINTGNSDIIITKLGNSFVSGISQHKSSNIKIYPNPTSNVIYIEGLTPEEKSVVTIYDVQGKLILSKEILDNTTIDISHLNQGVYMIRIGNVVQRIVKI